MHTRTRIAACVLSVLGALVALSACQERKETVIQTPPSGATSSAPASSSASSGTATETKKETTTVTPAPAPTPAPSEPASK